MFRKLQHSDHQHSGHAHNHSHHHHELSGGHDHTAHLAHDSRSLLIAIACTSSIFVVQLIGGWISNSISLLSDSAHMFLDMASLIIAFVGLRLALRNDKRDKFTFGWRRVEILSALFNGILLFVMCVMLLRESIERLMGKEAHVHAETMAFVSIIGLLANAVALYFLHGSEHLTTRSAYLHVLTDLLSSCAVVLGSIVMYYTGWELLDPILSILITLFIARSAYMLIKRTTIILMETVPETMNIEDIRKRVAEIEGITGVHDVHVWQLGSSNVAASMHVVHSMDISSDTALVLVSDVLQQEFGISHPTIQVESGNFADSHSCNCSMQSQPPPPTSISNQG